MPKGNPAMIRTELDEISRSWFGVFWVLRAMRAAWASPAGSPCWGCAGARRRRRELPGVFGVDAHAFEDFAEAFAQGRGFDGGDGFDAPVEVAVHPVGGADEEFLVAAVEEMIDAGMLEESAEDADDADVFGQSRDAGAQAAEAADDEVDFHAGLRGGVERLDDFRVLEGVHLGDDAGFAAGRGRARPRGGFSGETLAHVDRRDEQLAVIALERTAGEVVEEVDHVVGDLRVAGEQAEIGVELGGAGVVVAGADVAVGAYAVGLVADDHRDLGVRLEAR